MFEKLTSSFKKSIPEPLRKKLGFDVEESEQNSHEEHSSASSEGKNESGEKKNQVRMLIRVLIVIGLAYLFVDIFILSEKPQNEIVDVPVQPLKSKKPVPIKIEDKKVEESKILEQVSAEVKTEPVPEAKEATFPVENINITDKKIEENTQPKIEEASEKVAEQVPPEIPSTVGEVKPTGELDQNLDSLIDSVDAKDKTATEAQTKKETKLEDKIVADDVYVVPPSYDHLGRGLVYNCKEKYWACVDKLSYVNCNKNMKWNKTHQKPAECAVSNVYNSDDDCGVVQKYNISSSVPTPFCQ